MGTRIRLATPEDAATVCAVVRRSIAECCAEDHRNDPVLLNKWLANKTAPNIRSWLENTQACSVVAEVDGAIVGFGMSQADEVLLCYLVPEARFKGIGKSMLQTLETPALETGLPSLRLESTCTALPFYERNGFRPTGPAGSAFGLTVYPMAKMLAG
ncbi:MAG: GNAT family N-acetyltransferase [Polaromonas sp.]|nr:GNAT family N-acetyltransferase [Polaromonas sp.]